MWLNRKKRRRKKREKNTREEIGKRAQITALSARQVDRVGGLGVGRRDMKHFQPLFEEWGEVGVGGGGAWGGGGEGAERT